MLNWKTRFFILNNEMKQIMYDYLLIEQSNVARYEELTYPAFRPHLRKVAPDSSKVAIGVELDSEPIGLIFAEYLTTKATPSKKFGQILSFFVVPKYRSQGIGTTLLQKISAELKHRGCEKISLKYLDNPYQIALEKILKGQNWLTPEATALICYSTTAKLKNARIIKHLDRLSPTLLDDYTIFPWHSLTEADRDYLKGVMEIHPLTRKFSPFTEEKKIEPLNSLGLRYKDKVVGWMINHRTAPDTIRYTQMYVHPDYKPLSQSILFLGKAIKLQCEAVPEVPRMTCRVETDNTPMVNFVNRRLAPHLENIRRAWRVSRCL